MHRFIRFELMHSTECTQQMINSIEEDTLEQQWTPYCFPIRSSVRCLNVFINFLSSVDLSKQRQYRCCNVCYNLKIKMFSSFFFEIAHTRKMLHSLFLWVCFSFAYFVNEHYRIDSCGGCTCCIDNLSDGCIRSRQVNLSYCEENHLSASSWLAFKSTTLPVWIL